MEMFAAIRNPAENGPNRPIFIEVLWPVLGSPIALGSGHTAPHREGPLSEHTNAEGRTMTKLVTVLAILAGMLLVAPVIEYGTGESTNIFTAIGNAEGGAGGD